MSLWSIAVWGVLGGLAIELFDVAGQIRRDRHWLWRDPSDGAVPEGVRGRTANLILYLMAAAMRITAGGIVAAAAQANADEPEPLIAFLIGAGGPLVLQRLMGQIAVAETEPPPAAKSRTRHAAAARRTEPKRQVRESKPVEVTAEPAMEAGNAEG